MTRQKKEIWKQIIHINACMDADDILGCGFTPINTVEEERLDRLYDELARLTGFETYEEQMEHERFKMITNGAAPEPRRWV